MNHILCHPILENRLEALGEIELPVLPDIYTKIRDEITKESASAQSISQILEVDASLSADILKAVNSVVYGLRQPVSLLSQAISLLGFEEVSNIVLAVKVLEGFPPVAQKGIDPKRFWEHSLATACCARIIARFAKDLSKENRDEAFVAALLHDMGKLVEMRYFPNDFQKALALCRKELLTLEMAEKKVFEFSHQDVGAYLADTWNMSRNLVKTMEMHNTPWDLDEDDSSFALVSVVHVADVLARFMGLGSGGDPFIPPFHPACWSHLELEYSDIDEILSQARESYNDLLPILSRVPG